MLKKNINREIIKAILAYPPKEAPQILEQWKVAITAVGQEYEWTSIQYDYQTGPEITYGGMGKPMEIGQGKQLRNTRERCYNCNEERHTVMSMDNMEWDYGSYQEWEDSSYQEWEEEEEEEWSPKSTEE